MEGAYSGKIFSSCDPINVDEGELTAVEFGVDEMRAAAEEAHNHGKGVAAHSVGTRAIRNALDAGVDSIEHGIYLDEQLAETMATQRTYLVPTISGYHEMTNTAWGWPSEFLELYARLKDAHLKSTTVAHKKGVKIAVGTDSNGDMVDEMKFLLKCGMSAMEVIVGATMNGATLMGLEKNIGSVEPGKLADLLVIDGDPLSDFEALRRIEVVVMGGELFSKSEFGKWNPCIE